MTISSPRLLAVSALCWIGITASDAHGQSISSCAEFTANAHQAFDCIEGLLSQRPVHLTLSSIPPGNGFPIGVVYESGTEHVGRFKSLTDAKVGLVLSIPNGSWYSTGTFTWLPPLPYSHDQGGGADCHRLGPLCTNAVFGIQFYATHRDLKTLSFYGLGPDSPDHQYSFEQRDTDGGVVARMPLWNWLTAQGATEVQFSALPRAQALRDAGLTELSAPGLSSQPTYVLYSLGAHTTARYISEPATNPLGGPQSSSSLMKHRLVFAFTNNVVYGWHHDTDAGEFSYQEAALDADESIQFGSVLQRFVDPGSSWLVSAFCVGNKATDPCDFGTIHIKGLATLSRIPAGHMIPFYLQSTIGGSDIQSRSTLRGLDNYRLRDNNAAVLQAEYSKRILDPVGLLVFYDVGAVASTPSKLSLPQVKQDVGIGVTASLQGQLFAELYVAGGAKKGARIGYNLTKFF